EKNQAPDGWKQRPGENGVKVLVTVRGAWRSAHRRWLRWRRRRDLRHWFLSSCWLAAARRLWVECRQNAIGRWRSAHVSAGPPRTLVVSRRDDRFRSTTGRSYVGARPA